jgi:thiol-disulfide isomerase/thioredoxin
MNKKLLFFVFCILHITGIAQVNEKIGQKTPTPTVTDYILNTPKNKSLEGKYLVIEFWATWCAPCLAAVPHMNTLQEKFKKNKDVMFLSMTYETPVKAQHTTKRIDFKTVVVSDQTKKTHQQLGIEQDGMMLIPQTVVIHPNATILWIGAPESLTEAILEQLLLGKSMEEKPFTPTPEALAEQKTFMEEMERSNAWFERLTDTNTKSLFALLPQNSNSTYVRNNKSSLNGLNKGVYYCTNHSLAEIFGVLYEKPLAEIYDESNLTENYFSLYYKFKEHTDKERSIAHLTDLIQKSLGITLTHESKTKEGYYIQVKDEAKLIINTNPEENHSGNTESLLIFSQTKITTLINDLWERMGERFYADPRLNSTYDFILDYSSIDALKKSLTFYGLELIRKPITFEAIYLKRTN